MDDFPQNDETPRAVDPDEVPRLEPSSVLSAPEPTTSFTADQRLSHTEIVKSTLARIQQTGVVPPEVMERILRCYRNITSPSHEDTFSDAAYLLVAFSEIDSTIAQNIFQSVTKLAELQVEAASTLRPLGQTQQRIHAELTNFVKIISDFGSHIPVDSIAEEISDKATEKFKAKIQNIELNRQCAEALATAKLLRKELAEANLEMLKLQPAVNGLGTTAAEIKSSQEVSMTINRRSWIIFGGGMLLLGMGLTITVLLPLWGFFHSHFQSQ